MPTDKEVRAELEQVVESTRFANSGRLPQFLRHVVELALAGDADRLKGPVLAIEFFKRGKDFDPRIDPIVRVEARRLRARLEEFYSVEGAGHSTRIEIPRGGYVPVFLKLDTVPKLASSKHETKANGESPKARRSTRSEAKISPAEPLRGAHIATVNRSQTWLYVMSISLIAISSAWLWSRKGSPH